MRSAIIIKLSVCYYSFPIVTILCIRAPNQPKVPTAANTLELTPEHFREYAGAVEAFWKAVPSLDRV